MIFRGYTIRHNLTKNQKTCVLNTKHETSLVDTEKKSKKLTKNSKKWRKYYKIIMHYLI